MERILSQEDRIRRAEEIYNRRRTANRRGIRVSSDNVNTSKNEWSLFKKMALQLAICAVIYIIFYLIKNTNYIFSEDVINKTKEMLSYDINFGNAYAQVSSFIENNKNKFMIPGIVNEEQSNEQVNEQVNEQLNEHAGSQENTVENQMKNINEQETVSNQVTNTVAQGGVGGAEVNNVQEEKTNETVKKTQMEIDAEYVKKKYSFKIPLKGTITSRYGAREPTDIVSANHQGIDIGTDKGTAIYAAMEGTVTLVSSEGEYRKTCRNKKW